MICFFLNSTLIWPNMWTYKLYVCPKSVIPNCVCCLQSSFFLSALFTDIPLFLLRVPRICTFALYAMWSLKVRKVEQIKNEGCHAKDTVTTYIYFRRIAKILQKKNHHELLISHDFQAWSNLSIFCIIVFEDLVKTHLRLTKKTTSPLKLSSTRWIQAWTQAWPLPPVKWLLRSQQWEKLLPNMLCNVFLRFRRPLIRGIPEKTGQIKSLVGFEWLGFFHQKESDKKGKGGISREKVRDDVSRM